MTARWNVDREPEASVRRGTRKAEALGLGSGSFSVNKEGKKVVVFLPLGCH